jgi:hypothetical protein
LFLVAFRAVIGRDSRTSVVGAFPAAAIINWLSGIDNLSLWGWHNRVRVVVKV